MKMNNNNNISMVESKLPPGFRFHPRDQELVCDYLMKKVFSNSTNLSHHNFPFLIEVDLNKIEPWELPETACVGGKEWYFYSQRDRKYATGLRTNRATASGYWKATGKDRSVLSKGNIVGMRKTLVFYKGRAPKGRKSDWVMHEFRLQPPYLSSPSTSSSLKEDWVLCRVFYKNREISIKTSMGSSYYSESTEKISSSLPPLMDSYLTFDQTPQVVAEDDVVEDNDEYNKQVPCFSSFPHNPTNIPVVLDSDKQNNNNSKNSTMFGVLPTYHNHCFDSFSTDQTKVLNVVLNHLSQIENNNPSFKIPPCLGEAASSQQGYVSDVGFMPNIWTY